MSTVKYGLLVGSHFRPPAKVILEVLPQGTELEVRPEPENPYDPQAKAVYIKSTEIQRIIDESSGGSGTIGLSFHLLCQLESNLLGCGHTLDTLLAQSEWHLGYLARESNKDLQKKAGASPTGQLVPAAAAQEGRAELFWGPNGEALVKIQE